MAFLKQNKKQLQNPLRELVGSGTLSKPAKQLLKEFRKNESKYE